MGKKKFFLRINQRDFSNNARLQSSKGKILVNFPQSAEKKSPMFTTTLSKNAQNALALLGESSCLPKETYLAGGSALALHFGHRISLDFAAMKPAAIMDRGTKKDFIDLFFIIKNGITMEKVFGYYDRKYQALANNVYSLIVSLSYFDDAEKTDMPEMLVKTSWEEVRRFFEKEAIRLAKKYL